MKEKLEKDLEKQKMDKHKLMNQKLRTKNQTLINSRMASNETPKSQQQLNINSYLEYKNKVEQINKQKQQRDDSRLKMMPQITNVSKEMEKQLYLRDI